MTTRSRIRCGRVLSRCRWDRMWNSSSSGCRLMGLLRGRQIRIGSLQLRRVARDPPPLSEARGMDRYTMVCQSCRITSPNRTPHRHLPENCSQPYRAYSTCTFQCMLPTRHLPILLIFIPSNPCPMSYLGEGAYGEQWSSALCTQTGKQYATTHNNALKNKRTATSQFKVHT